MRASVMIVAGAVMLLGAQQAVAQIPPSAPPAHGVPERSARYIDPSNGLSLDDAIALALKQEPGLRAARTEIDAAVARRQQAALRANPSASFEHREEPGGSDNQTTLAVQLPLELFRRSTRVAAAEQEIAVSRFEFADRERRLAADVRARYGEVIIAIRELAVLEELLSAVRRQHELVAARSKEGAAPALERDLLDVEARRLEADHPLHVAHVETALVELKRSLGIDPETPLAVRDTLETLAMRESATPMVQKADDHIRTRPDVLAAEAQMKAAESRIRQASSEGRFDLTVFATYMRTDAGFPQMGFAPSGGIERVRGTFNYLAGGAMVMVPLLNRHQGAIAAARAERAGAEAAHDAAILQARADLAAARVQDVSAQASVREYRDAVRSIARRNLDVITETYTLGRATVFDVLNEQRRYLDVERAYTAALRSAFEARTRLVLALGVVR